MSFSGISIPARKGASELGDHGRVLLVSGDGASAEFRPVGYQFGVPPARNAEAGESDADWDANWLMIRGEIRTADGRAWQFSEPCLTTWEAGHLSAWLQAAASQDPPGHQDEAVFTEPNLSFVLDGRDSERVRIRVRFAHESRPGWLPREASGSGDREYVLPLDVRRSELVEAVQSWDLERRPFPER